MKYEIEYEDGVYYVCQNGSTIAEFEKLFQAELFIQKLENR